MNSGIIIVHKEADWTSFDVIAKLRGVLGERKLGHSGTLDPNATGVLPVFIKKATKACDLVNPTDKRYIATLKLGIRTNTLDIWGEELLRREVNASAEDVKRELESFIGDIEQLPPMYSAVKIDGKKLLSYARAGKEVERKPRPTSLYSAKIVDLGSDEYKIEIHCAKGFYVRTLIDDIGGKLGCGAVMTSLIRTASGPFSIENAKTISEIEELVRTGEIEKYIMPLETAFDNLATSLSEYERVRFLNGGKFNRNNKDGIYKAFFEGSFLGLLKVLEGKATVYKNFFEEQ